MKFRRNVAAAAVAAVIACGAGPLAADPIRIGHTINPAPAPVFVADLQGLFAARGVEVVREVMTADPVVPAALMSGSVEVSTVSPTTFLAAVANGLDLVAFAGTSVTTADSRDIALVTRTGGIADPAGFAGATVGIPGIGALLDVMLRQWLTQKGVDPSAVTYVEVPFPQQGAQLQAGRVDAVMTPGQFSATMVSEGYGQVLSYPVTELPEGLPTLVVATTRAWADANPDAIAAIRAALADAQTVSEAEPDKLRAALVQVMNLPEPVAARVALPVIRTGLTTEGLAYWADAMRAQGLLPGEVDLSAVVLP
ncbi:MAG: ABC transporter substrate-binding protein [Rhodobacteraceae bacterium]|jgi:NitT/TauT family transport system substrate-binding protein|nr:ABC transporter substrate-binding protein [Paracoccaceae bacterium]